MARHKSYIPHGVIPAVLLPFDTELAIDEPALRAELADPTCGGYCAFEGLVRNHNEGMQVRHLEYEAFEPLAIKEGERKYHWPLGRRPDDHPSLSDLGL